MNAIKNLFSGRMGRGLFFFSVGFISTLREVLSAFYHNYKRNNDTSSVVPVLIVVLLLAIFLLIINLSIFAKRFHDTGRSGYWSLLGVIPYIQWIVFVYLLFKMGDDKKNKYGKKPQGLIF